MVEEASFERTRGLSLNGLEGRMVLVRRYRAIGRPPPSHSDARPGERKTAIDFMIARSSRILSAGRGPPIIPIPRRLHGGHGRLKSIFKRTSREPDAIDRARRGALRLAGGMR